MTWGHSDCIAASPYYLQPQASEDYNSSNIPFNYSNSTTVINMAALVPCSNSIRYNNAFLLLAIQSFPRAVCTSAFHSAQHMFDKMLNRDSSSQKPSLSQALYLAKHSSQKPGISIVSALHCLALKTGSVDDTLTSTSLLTVYSRAGDLGSAQALFNDIVTKDVVSWNAIISSYVYNHRVQAALALFGEMMKDIGEFDSTTLLVVLSALSRSNSFKQCRVLHGISLKLCLDSDSFLANALTNMYGKLGDLNSAESMFLRIKYRDTTSWNSIMGVYLYNGYPRKTLSCFREMSFSGIQADAVSLSCFISACSCLEEVGAGKSVHGWGIKSSYDEISHLSVANALISFYLKFNDVNAAEKVFCKLIVRDVVSWNAMIGGFAEKGRVSEALGLLRKMQLDEMVQPNLVTAVTILPLCAELNLPQQGRSIHGFTMRRGLWLDLVVTNSLMNMYSKCNILRSSEILFKAMPNRDLISWNTMIAGYTQNGCSKEAWVLFRELLGSGMQCSMSTVLAILPSCDCQEALDFGELVHCWILKSGFSNNVFTVNALMFMYMNCGDMVACFSLFQSISVIADVDSWNTVIVGCVRNGYPGEALEAFNLMRQLSRVNPDPITMVSILSVCGNLGLVFYGKFIHGFILKTLMEPDLRVRNALITMYCRCDDIKSAESIFCRSHCSRNLCSWNCMISGLAQNKDGKRALKLFRHMEFDPNEITIVSILSACTQLGALRHGMEINGYAFRFGLHQNAFISAALVDMYSKCGRLEISVRVFRNSMEKSVASWNSMISAYGFHGHGKKAIELFLEMCESGIRGTRSTFISLLSACSHSGLVDEGQLYYNLMTEEFGINPTTEHHVCMVDMLGRAGRLAKAYEFIKQIPTEPAAGVWGALLSACKDHGNLEMGKSIAKHLFCLEPENAGYYVSLSHMYAAVGRWPNAVEVRRMAEDKGLKKPPGCSLIDVCLG
ncbi:pentatricopeptide repeat-containing protein At4g19220, mitochondrial-like [Magnolia sinica]|uniref:pentatricopeptide repeat-containing protein At4g19220, mitochondrial-like n=1 Tax=Magnolia sinica TaxID=86752 RepID=UPI00265B38A3|nr:pentatricopeptide repeat-containing protein At4g19220, mitochondrial-like [Magnolia sinica]